MVNSKVLITGATGFLGSYLVKELLRQNYDVIILKRSCSDTKRINDVLDKLICYNIDDCDLIQIFHDFVKIDLIIHTATLYGNKNENISELLYANTVFPLHLLELGCLFNTETFFNTDTSLNKNFNNYSLSKKQFMEWGKQLAYQKKIRFINIQLERIFGFDDDDSKFIPYLIKSCLKNVPYINLTPGEQQRDFIYIYDVLSAYSLLLNLADHQPKWYQDYDLGSGEVVTLQKFVETVKCLTNSSTELRFGAIPYRANEIMISQANLSKLQRLGWQPNFTLEDGLRQTIALYTNNQIQYHKL